MSPTKTNNKLRNKNKISAIETNQHETNSKFNNNNNGLRQKRLQQQTILNYKYNDENLPFGDDITKDYDCEGFLFHNVNGIKNEHNWFQILSTMKDLNITFFGIAETNTTMHGYFFHKWNEHVRKVFRVSKTEASESDIKFDSEYKPGGTFSAIVDKWQARVTEKGSDNSGLGRWNHIIISSNKKKLVVITAYKPCKTGTNNRVDATVDTTTRKPKRPRSRKGVLQGSQRVAPPVEEQRL